MPSYSPAGFHDFPVMSDDALNGRDPRYNSRLMGWLDEAIAEGDGFIQQDPNYHKMAEGMAYVSGDHKLGIQGIAAGTLGDIEKFTLNLCRRAAQAHVSALTDLKPTFGWRSLNPKYAPTADLLNKLTIAWYLNNMADVAFADVMKIAWACGTADMMIEWDSQKQDHLVIAKDPRDTLPIRPSRYGGVQAWQGVIFREVHSVNVLRDMYPQHAGYIVPTADGLLASIRGLFQRIVPPMQSPAADTLSGLSGVPRGAGPVRSGDVLYYRCYLTDRSRNLKSVPVVVGDPTKPWAYTVEPGDLLYPNKRLIIRTDRAVLYDGGAPYLHGLYPFVRFMPWRLPWFFLGQSALADLTPVNDAINRLGRGVLLGLEQWLNRSTIIDTNAVGETAARVYNARRPGQNIKLRGQVIDVDKAFKAVEGPAPQVLALAGQTLTELTARFESLAGTGNLEALQQLKQLPAEGTIEKFYQAMTPELRLEGRMFEAFLRDASQQILHNSLQFQTSAKRIHLLGDAGATLEDFDLEPGTLLPAMPQTLTDPMTGMPTPNPDYDPAFDSNLPRDVRAKAMAKLMAFVVAPNSVLAFNAQEEKMMDFQLARMGYLDIWTLMERLERPNMGAPPPIPLPPIKPPTTPEELQEGLMTGRFIPNPTQPGTVLEMRAPLTITERLMAQQMLGIGMTQNPAGRKASGGDSPKVEEKDGGSRTTVTESEK